LGKLMHKHSCRALALNLLLLFAVGQSVAASDPPLGVGDPARFFLCRDLQGNPFVVGRSLLGNKGCVLSFFTPQCEFCLKEIPALAELVSTKFPGMVLLFVGVDPFSGNPEQVRTYLKSLGIVTGGLFDESGRISLLYGVESFPTIIAIDRGMRIAYRKTGYRDGDLESLEHVLAEIASAGGRE